LRTSNPRLYQSARKHFGGWRLAIQAAGIEAGVPQRWNNVRIINAIRRLHSQGTPLTRVWREDKNLYRAAFRVFGSWKEAMRAAGYTRQIRERWTKHRVIERLQVCDQRRADRTIRDLDPGLCAAAARLFGSYDAALEAAGVDPPPRRWTKARVTAAIQDRYIRGKPKHIEGLGDPYLANAAKRFFGSWQAAVKAAGLAGRIPIKKPLRRWSKEEVVREIQKWHDSGGRLEDVSKLDQSLCGAAKTWFGSWRAAVQAAGFQTAHRSWTKQSIVAEIRNRVQNGRSLSSHEPSNRSLVMVAYRHFGSWRAALQAAGVEKPQRGRKGA
jgi:hypothetical protein